MTRPVASRAAVYGLAAAEEFTRAVAPDPVQGEPMGLLTEEELTRLVYLLALLNDTSVTQLDTDEADDLSRLLYKISNDGEEKA